MPRPQASCHPSRIAAARGLCGSCYKRATRLGTLPPKRPLVDREHVLAIKRARYAANSERIKAQTSASAKRHREARRLRTQRRRARLAGTNSPGVSPAEWADIVRAFDNACAYCGTTTAPLTVDHVVPISRGGKDDADNVIPACGSCNSRKGAKTFEEYLASRSVIDGPPKR